MMLGRDIVVVAASAGGLRPMRDMLRGLPADLPAALFVVLHVPATGGSSLPSILDRAGPLAAAGVVDGERVRPGRVYVAPPDRHLLIVKDTVRLSRGPRQNGLRPAADPLFRSAALYAGRRTIAVVLSGTLDDASLGSATVERRGGLVLVQDPAEADYNSMPRSAIAATNHALVTPAGSLADEVTRLATEDAGLMEAPEPDGELAHEIGDLLAWVPEPSPRDREFGGVMGHRWSPQRLLEEQSTTVERAMRLAIRSLEERARLSTRLADGARSHGHPLSADQFAEAAKEASRSADAIREVTEGITAEAIPDTAGA